MGALLFLTIAVYITLAANAASVVVHWNVSWVDHVNPDGRHSRSALGVNGVWPIPPVIATEGDTLVLHVYNGLSVKTAIHAHGIFQRGSNFYDGCFPVTECGIAPGSSFTYHIPLQQTGTYWLHGHNQGQYVDGLRTALVIQPKNEPLSPSDYILTLGDWYHNTSTVLLESFLSPQNPEGEEPVPKAALINDGLPTTLFFKPGQTYHLHLISVSAFANFHFFIDGHTFSIIEVDGVAVAPYEADIIPIAPAQRYVISVTAKDSAVLNYHLHSNMEQTMFATPCKHPDTSIPIVYDGRKPFAPKGGAPSDPSLFNQGLIQPISLQNATLDADKTVVLNVRFNLYTDGLNHGAFNFIPWQQPRVPTALSAMTNSSLVLEPAFYGPSAQASVLDYNSVVRIVVNNFDEGSHPFHLHGHTFQVLHTSKNGVFNPAKHSHKLNLKNPLRRDTTIVPAGGFAVLQFIANNPGVWYFHCHIDWHLVSGLSTVFVEAPLQMQQMVKVPANTYSQCQAQNQPTSGNSAGKMSLTDFGNWKPLIHFGE